MASSARYDVFAVPGGRAVPLAGLGTLVVGAPDESGRVQVSVTLSRRAVRKLARPGALDKTGTRAHDARDNQ